MCPVSSWRHFYSRANLKQLDMMSHTPFFIIYNILIFWFALITYYSSQFPLLIIWSSRNIYSCFISRWELYYWILRISYILYLF